jgi:membrane protein YdbS with pleckstrin-like domain
MPPSPDLPPDSSTESPVWSGSPSQWLNIVPFVLCLIVGACFIAGAFLWQIPLIAAGAAIPLVIAVWNWLTVRSTKVEVTTERITTQTGILSRRREDLELYRVKDTTLQEPLLLRLVSRANILMRTSDRSTPLMVLPAIKDAEALRQKIRANVERLRTKRGVREMDMDVES